MGNQYRLKKKAFKIGRSCAITLPHVWCKWNDVEFGSEVFIEIREKELVISVEGENGRAGKVRRK